jgi:hypothetical protein
LEKADAAVAYVLATIRLGYSEVRVGFAGSQLVWVWWQWLAKDVYWVKMPSRNTLESALGWVERLCNLFPLPDNSGFMLLMALLRRLVVCEPLRNEWLEGYLYAIAKTAIHKLPISDTDSMPPAERFYLAATKWTAHVGAHELTGNLCARGIQQEAVGKESLQWVWRRWALALLMLGVPAEALRRFAQIPSFLYKFYHWHEIAKCHRALQQPAAEVFFLAKAALCADAWEFKLAVLEDIASWIALAKLPGGLRHEILAFVDATRVKKGWPMKHSGVYRDCLPPNAHSLRACLVGLVRHKPEFMLEGRVAKLLHEGEKGDGFVTGTGGKSFYFRMQTLWQPGVLTVGDAVWFDTAETKHKDKLGQTVSVLIKQPRV